MAERRIYIEPTPLDDALDLWRGRLTALGAWAPLGPETVAVEEALGRVTAGPVFALASSPSYHGAAMDGVAVRFADTIGASERAPARLKLGEQAVYVDTGDPLPEGFDAVIMVEEIDELEGGSVEIIAPATPWQHVRVVGEDIVATELVLPENHVIRPEDVAALIASGHTEAGLRRRPKVAFIPTGDEMVEPGAIMKRGDIVEYNSRMLGAMAQLWGADTVRHGIVPDSPEALKDALARACEEADVVAVLAGSSAGAEDFTYGVIESLGEVYLHGLDIKPGKPLILGEAGGRPVMGIPGYPVSAYITFMLFGRGLIHAMRGVSAPEPETMSATLSRQLSSTLGQLEFVRVKVGSVRGRMVATPLARGAGLVSSLIHADGFLRVPAPSEGVAAGSEVEVELIREMASIENTVVVIGSHDNALDLLASYMKRRHPEFGLSSAHVGSMGGLMAVKRGEAHMAGCHLLDEQSGEYNVSYIKKHLPDVRCVLVNLVHRAQGFIVPKGNPKGIRGFEDLDRPDVTFVNRQAGAGTRLLTDLHLRRLGIPPGQVRGYDNEQYTHMGVASAVASGVADTGLGILAAARALGLEFIPVANERYDLVVPEEFYDTPMVAALMEVIRADAGFRAAVEAMGGYDASDMGKVMWRG